MPLQDDMQLISVDDHLIEPSDLWVERLPRKYHNACPKVVEATVDNLHRWGGGKYDEWGTPIKPGDELWVYEDVPQAQLGLNAVAGRPKSQLGLEPVRYKDMIPGCYDPVERIKDMDLDGVQAALCYPSLPRFAGTLFQESRDMELGNSCVRAWNDYVLDEWCAAGRDRFIPLVIVPYWDVDLAVAEIERTAAKGAKSVSLPENMSGKNLPSFHTDHWDRLFSAIEDAEMPVSMHFGSSGRNPMPSLDGPMAVMITLMGTSSICAAADLLFSPVFHRHPKLRVVLAEGGIGWLPWLLERADTTFQRHRFYQNINQDLSPGELFRRHLYGCFIADDFGLLNRSAIGVDKIMWECDYPHSDSNWPNSRKVAAEAFASVPDEEVRKIVESNARELFRFPRN